MIFSLLLLGFGPGENYGGSMWDAAEELPEFYIIRREIGKAVTGQDFFANAKETGKPEYFQAIKYETFRHYYDMWDDFHYFGYPNKLDWRDAAQWFNTILKRFENAYKKIEFLIEEKAMRRANGN